MIQIRSFVLRGEVKNQQSNLNDKIQSETNGVLMELGEAVLGVDVKMDGGSTAVVVIQYDPTKVKAPASKPGK